MLNRNRRIATGLAGLTLAALLALPAAALANTSGPIASTGGMTVQLPFMGGSLSVAVTLDAVGNITNVDLTPPGAFSATGVSPHAVSFATTGDTTKVSVRALGSKMSVRASSGSLDDLLGPGTWSAKLFGGATASTVAYTVGKDGAGKPTLVIGAVSVPADVTYSPVPPVVETTSNEWGSSAGARIAFDQDGFTMWLKIRVSLRNEGDRPASLSIQLSGKDRQTKTGSLAALGIGPHTWTGVGCDGTTAMTLHFTVNADGTVSFTNATPAATVVDPEKFGFGFKNGFHDSEHGFKGSFFIARFDGTHTNVMVWLKQNEDLTYTLVVSARADRCRGTDATNPTYNTPTAPDARIGDHSSGFGDGHFGFGGFSGKH